MMKSVVGQDIYDVRQSVVNLGLTGKSWEWVWAVRKHLKERELKKKKPKDYSNRL